MTPTSLLAAGADAPYLEGSALNLLWCIPFVGLLLSIAVFPLVAEDFWHAHFGKIALMWATILFFPMVVMLGSSVFLFELLHIALLEYFPFVILLLSLFTISGGIKFESQLFGTPILNVLFLLVGTFIASFTGTTGAAILLIRPLLEANKKRQYKTHTVVFFIFLVANIGGSLTPLGDPPLFLGFLKGVDFFWPLQNLLLPMLFVSGVLLLIYFVLDSWFFKREKPEVANIKQPHQNLIKSLSTIKVKGGINFILLLGVLSMVLLSGIWKPNISFNVYHIDVELQNLVRDATLLVLVLLSLRLTSPKLRADNGFTWFPIVEVAKLFAAIFFTVAPVIAILRAGDQGSLSAITNMISDSNGQPINSLYFWVTGILSSFLDNAPTYLVFFNTAGGDPAVLTSTLNNTLLAISAGAVFMGAVSYIGNAPNFMVRSIAIEQGIKMPSFFGFMAWSCCFLMPIFLLVTVIFF
ncbi:MAG: sodium:proton antiporter [Pseudomonadota bacterium]